MASTSAYFFKIFTPFPTSKRQKYPPVRSQRFRDDGKSANIVDANMSTLGHRIKQVRIKERLNTAWYRSQDENGWNYKNEYDDTYKERALFVQSLELAALVGSTIGLVFLFGSIFICLYPLGKSYNIVDANMSKLGRRIEQLRMKERLNTAWYRSHEDQINGWNYKNEYDDTYKERALFVQSLELAALVGSTIGLVFFAGSIFICLYSLVIQINIHT